MKVCKRECIYVRTTYLPTDLHPDGSRDIALSSPKGAAELVRRPYEYGCGVGIMLPATGTGAPCSYRVTARVTAR